MCLPQALLPFRFASLEFGCRDSRLVGLDGLEPSTSRLSGVRSSHLSYRPVFSQVFQFVHLSRFYPWWWRWRDSNPWPPACRAGALPTELHPRKKVKSEEWKVKSVRFALFLLRVCLSGLKLNPDNWTTKSINTHDIHIYQVFVLIWLRVLNHLCD